MPNPCCCGPCNCVGCVKIQLFDVDATSAEPIDQEYIDNAYNRTITLWRSTKSSSSPYDLLDNASSVCTTVGLEPEDYPGTKCVLVGYLCCDPDLQNDPPSGGDPLDPGDPPPPPPPPPL